MTEINSIISATQFSITYQPDVPLVNATIVCCRPWKHVWLSQTGHRSPLRTSVATGLRRVDTAYGDTTNPGIGIFVYRSQTGSGNVNFRGVQMRWNYAAQGLADTAKVDIRVFALEMVYIPGGVDFAFDREQLWSYNGSNFITINTGNASVPQSGMGSIIGTGGGSPNNGTASSSFPNGYNAFYCMKYELSQGQFRDFLNHIDRFEQLMCLRVDTVGRYMGGIYYNSSGQQLGWRADGLYSFPAPMNRNGIRLIINDGGRPRTFACDLSPSSNLPNGTDSTNDGEWIAVNFLQYTSMALFLNWSGLRFMTLCEFQKASRGTEYPIAKERAWGDTTEVLADTVINSGTAAESVLPVNANTHNLWAAKILGPLRCGALASTNDTRASSGTSFYGVQDLSGNLWEPYLIDLVNGVYSYTGAHGSGDTRYSGGGSISLPPGWPSFIQSSYMRITNGRPVALGDYSNDNPSTLQGLRGVRSAP